MSDPLSFQWAQDNLKIVVASGTGLIAAIVTAWKFGGRIVNIAKRVIEIVNGALAVLKFAASFNDRMDRIEGTMSDRFASIEKELKPNGGDSLRDIVDGLRSSQMFQDRSYEAMLDLHDEPYFKSDRFGLCVWVNRAYLRLIGKSTEETRGNGWINAIHPDDRSKVFAEWRAAIDQNRNFEMEYRVLSPGGPIIVRADAKALRDPKGNLIGFIGSICCDQS